jgi:hypothetical protein
MDYGIIRLYSFQPPPGVALCTAQGCNRRAVMYTRSFRPPVPAYCQAHGCVCCLNAWVHGWMYVSHSYVRMYVYICMYVCVSVGQAQTMQHPQTSTHTINTHTHTHTHTGPPRGRTLGATR